MSNWNTFLKSVPAGVMIGLGVTAFISSENKVFGSILFCLGLFGICAFGFNLFTGKIGYVIPTKNNPNCLMIWLGNLVGCLITTVPLRFANPKYNEAAVVLAENKLSQNFLQTFILGIFCGMIMYIVIENYSANSSPLGKYLGIFLGIPAFIFAGFEHSIADICYFSYAASSLEQVAKMFVYILTVSVANGVGSIIFRAFTVMYKEKVKK